MVCRVSEITCQVKSSQVRAPHRRPAFVALGKMGNCSSTRDRLANIDLSTANGGMQASQTVGQGGPAAKQDCFILKERCLAAGSPNRLSPLAPQHVATLAC